MARVPPEVVIAVCQFVALAGVAIIWLTVQGQARLYLQDAGAPAWVAALTVLAVGVAGVWLVAPLPGPKLEGSENAPEANRMADAFDLLLGLGIVMLLVGNAVMFWARELAVFHTGLAVGFLGLCLVVWALLLPQKDSETQMEAD